jgi:pimeloyl-ACP methyl ester carboxylesterase
MTLTTLLLSETNLKVSFRAKGAGDPVVLIHGVGMQSAAWTPQLDHFADQYHVIALDMPGHGGSDPLPISSKLPDYVAWCQAVIEALGFGPVNIAGHSMGALIAGGIAASHPDLIRRAALLNGVFLRDEAARTAVQARAADIRNGKIDLETPLARWFDVHQTEARAQVAGWLGAVDQTGYATAYTAFAEGDATYAAQFPQIACPFLAMTGDGDPNSTPAMSEAMATAVQNGQHVTIAGHRHMINLTAIGDVNAHLSQWLNRPLDTKDMQ